ncbi:MAG: outer membrane protein assembly factor BamE [Rhodocyclaceae bacterium]|nr:outer membrane protein assembly factor BamE [Rhodocyclaceae bacterium]
MKLQKMRNYVVIASSVLVLVGCASVGNHALKDETNETVAQKIKENETTKEQVKQTLGAPSEVTFTDSGKEIWKYMLANMKADAVNFIPFMGLFGSSYTGTKKELIILFDGNIVQRYTMSESDASVKTGVFK